MSAFDVIGIAVAAFLTGWFVGGLVRLETEGNRWPLVRKFLLMAFQSGVLFLAVLCLSWWRTYHHLPPWQTFIDSPCLSSARAAILVYRNETRERFHIPSRPRRRSQTV